MSVLNLVCVIITRGHIHRALPGATGRCLGSRAKQIQGAIYSHSMLPGAKARVMPTTIGYCLLPQVAAYSHRGLPTATGAAYSHRVLPTATVRCLEPHDTAWSNKVFPGALGCCLEY